jgi:hypothetical protein
MHTRIRTITLLLLAAAWFVAVVWLVRVPDFEPALTSLALLATMSTLYVDHWLSQRERRRELLATLAHELFVNLQTLNDPVFSSTPVEPHRPVVFPRLSLGSTVNVIASGAFTTTRDTRLFKLLHAWRERADDFNHSLWITEVCSFVVRDPKEIGAFREKLGTGRVLQATRQAFRDLSDHLLVAYSSESGITRDSVLFGDPSHERAA